MTIGALKAVRQAGLQDTVAMVGFDDFQLADILVPGITVVTQDIAQLGRLATRLLFDRLDEKDTPLGTHVVPTRLTARGSGRDQAHHHGGPPMTARTCWRLTRRSSRPRSPFACTLTPPSTVRRSHARRCVWRGMA